jgi:cell division protein FtsL
MTVLTLLSIAGIIYLISVMFDTIANMHTMREDFDQKYKREQDAYYSISDVLTGIAIVITIYAIMFSQN